MTKMNRIRELRMKKGMSQRELGNQIGTAQQTISRLEAENYSPPADLIINLAEFFDVSIDYLLGCSDYKERYEDRNSLDSKWEEYREFLKKYDKFGEVNKKTLEILLERLLETEQCNDKGFDAND